MNPDTEESDFSVAEDVHLPTYQLASDILEESPVDYTLADIVTKLWHLHPQLKGVSNRHRYYVKGEANKIGMLMTLSQNWISQRSAATKDFDLKFWGKSTGKLLKILWPIHVLLYVLETCTSKADLEALAEIPHEIDSELAVYICATIYQNSYHNYRIPLTCAEVRNGSPEDSTDLQVPVAEEILRKLLVDSKSQILCRNFISDRRIGGGRAKTTDVFHAFETLQRARFGSVVGSGGKAVFNKGTIPQSDNHADKLLFRLNLKPGHLKGFKSPEENNDVEWEETVQHSATVIPSVYTLLV